MTNLRLSFSSHAAQAYGDPHGAFAFAMGIYKGRAWRYTLAHGLLLLALVLVVLAVVPYK